MLPAAVAAKERETRRRTSSRLRSRTMMHWKLKLLVSVKLKRQCLQPAVVIVKMTMILSLAKRRRVERKIREVERRQMPMKAIIDAKKVAERKAVKVNNRLRKKRKKRLRRLPQPTLLTITKTRRRRKLPQQTKKSPNKGLHLRQSPTLSK